MADVGADAAVVTAAPSRVGGLTSSAQSRPLVLIHGDVLAGPLAWLAQRSLAGGRSCTLFERDGFGARHHARIDAAADAQRLLDEVNEDPAVDVVAHSHGAVAALLAAARHPERFASLTLIEPPVFQAAYEDPASRRTFRAAVSVLALVDLSSPAVVAARFARVFGLQDGACTPALVPRLAELARRVAHGAWPWEHALDLAPVRQVPVLVVDGGWDAGFSAVSAQLAALTGGEHVLIPGFGHNPQRAGAPFDEKVASFMARSRR